MDSTPLLIKEAILATPIPATFPSNPPSFENFVRHYVLINNRWYTIGVCPSCPAVLLFFLVLLYFAGV
jgi:hypothetical protein